MKIVPTKIVPHTDVGLPLAKGTLSFLRIKREPTCREMQLDL